MSSFDLFATAAHGLEATLLDELASLGVTDLQAAPGGVIGRGTLEVAYKSVLWSRIAGRVLVEIGRFVATDAESLYAGARAIPWHEHLTPTTSFAVHATRAPGAPESLTHTHFIALKVKDAVVDALRDRTGTRPNVDTHAPELTLIAHVAADTRIYVDLGGSLHERGYRAPDAKAPLRETLAAGLLRIAGYTGDQPLVDPFCGSGTILVEAALIAANRAPGLSRLLPRGWRGNSPATYTGLLAEARAAQRGLPSTNLIFGSDVSAYAIAQAKQSSQRAELAEWVTLFAADAISVAPPATATPGLVVTNPPYGERLDDPTEAAKLLEQFGDNLRRQYLGWNAFVLAGDERRGATLGLKPRRKHVLFNGAIECRFLDVPISPRATIVAEPGWRTKRSAEAEVFANRLRKNVKHLAKWAKRDEVSCMRLYDADIPEFGLAVDRYENWAYISEYAYPQTVDEKRAEERRHGATAAVAEVLEIPPAHVVMRERRRHARGEQYERLAASGELHEIHEAGFTFLVNFIDYLDTGIFLDQRRLRARIESMAAQKRFLNLFSYTGSATVYAARGGARATVSVDLSNTYLDWSEKNFAKNRLPTTNHRLERADVLEFVRTRSDLFDLIFVSPPSFSNSKAMTNEFDIERDHGTLIVDTAKLLSDGGTMLFSTHRRKFTLDQNALATAKLTAREITHETMSPDFARRDPTFHRCWELRRS